MSCSPECQHGGVCDEIFLLCNCTFLFTGDSCESLIDPVRWILIILLFIILLLLIFVFFVRWKEHKVIRKWIWEFDVTCRLQKKQVVPEDPFLSSLFNMHSTQPMHHMVLGDRVQSRDSYLNSNHHDRDRWWKSRPKYSSVSTQEESLYVVCS